MSVLSQLADNISSSMEDFRQKISENDFPFVLRGIHGGFLSFVLENALKAKSSLKNLVVIVPTEKDGEELYSDLQNIFEGKIYQFPWWGTLPYRPAPKGSNVFSRRAAFLAELLSESDEPRIFIAGQRAFQTPVPPPQYIKSLMFRLEVGADFDSAEIARRLTNLGYLRVPRVSSPGEFVLRGEVLDIFPANHKFPVRFIFDFDKIEKIKFFDSENQLSLWETDAITVPPMKEVVWTEELVLSLTDKTEKKGLETEITSDLFSFGEAEGEEFFYKILFETEEMPVHSLADYFSQDTFCVFTQFERLLSGKSTLLAEFNGLYRPENGFPLPQDLLLDFHHIESKCRNAIYCRSLNEETSDNPLSEIDFAGESSKNFFSDVRLFKEYLGEIGEGGGQAFLFAGSENQSVRLKELFSDFSEFLTVLPQGLSRGFSLPAENIFVIEESEIFSRKKKVTASVRKAKSSVIDTFVELNPGDYVVHENYGIGRFEGIELVQAAGNKRDYIKLIYANDDSVFIPIEQADLIQRYIGNSGDAPKLDSLGSKSWNSRKERVRKAVEELAERLLSLYSKRKTARGFAFSPDSEWQLTFEANFPYVETPDQITCIREVKEDMEKPVPMDRLICGDVGYGKTEIALRAAFKAVVCGKQVAFLAPTTLLCEQHYETCLERFTDFPVKIEMLSRFVEKSKQKKIIERLKSGDIDIIVGTHRLIQKDIVFKDLGLMIIDEEQRFGVKDKERLKEMKTNVDCLALSATPIPRTLHMSLLKIRDMSILNTPPENRRPIETIIDECTDERIMRAIRSEIQRGGQVFFLHNRVESLEGICAHLRNLLPEVMIDYAHGRMGVDELDDIFRRFKNGGFHVLVSTTIIENGIDIPTVNTIIIDRADMYGVSQLYQLRGRVGRSDKKAYAYLLYPGNRILSEIAMKRLQVISDFTDLGSGFKIAMKDMEIRGAGNLLGRDQSGDIYSVGFDMYLHLLEQAIQKLQNENYEAEDEVMLELEYSGFIPSTYISNEQTKMEFYKKIAAISSEEELTESEKLLQDRFGVFPPEVKNLLTLAKIRIACKNLHVKNVKELKGVISVEFSRVSDISVDKVVNLIQTSEGKIRLDPTRPNLLKLTIEKMELNAKGEFLIGILESLQ